MLFNNISFLRSKRKIITIINSDHYLYLYVKMPAISHKQTITKYNNCLSSIPFMNLLFIFTVVRSSKNTSGEIIK